MLTGTPLQNNVDELFSLLSFLEPRQFSSSEAFMAEFGKLETEGQVDKLKAVSKVTFKRLLCLLVKHGQRQTFQNSIFICENNVRVFFRKFKSK